MKTTRIAKSWLVPCALMLAIGAVRSSAQVAVGSSSGFAADRLARIDRVFQQFVDEDRLGGAVALVLRDGKPVYERAFGWRDKEARRQDDADTVFRIASQTKALDQRRDPVADRRRQARLERSGGPLHPGLREDDCRRRAGDADVKSSPRSRAITIRDLLTHTAGISYGTNASVASQYEAKGLGPAAGLRLVHRRQGRAHLHDDGAARRRCPSWRSRAKRGSTATTPTSSAALPSARRGCRSTSSSARGSRVRSA